MFSIYVRASVSSVLLLLTALFLNSALFLLFLLLLKQDNHSKQDKRWLDLPGQLFASKPERCIRLWLRLPKRLASMANRAFGKRFLRAQRRAAITSNMLTL
eukprot:g69004.t1